MTIDKFGRSLKASSSKNLKGLKGEGFNLTPDGDYDMQNKKLCNLASPLQAADAATKSYVDYRSVPFSEGKYDMQNRRIWQLADPKVPTDAVNLRTLNKLSLKLTKNNYNAQHKQINSLAAPSVSDDAATKFYVDKACEESVTLLRTDLSMVQSEIDGLKTRLTKCESLITDNKTEHEKNLRKFGTYVFNYINRKQTGRSAVQTDDDYIDWEELFKLSTKDNSSPTENIAISHLNDDTQPQTKDESQPKNNGDEEEEEEEVEEKVLPEFLEESILARVQPFISNIEKNDNTP